MLSLDGYYVDSLMEFATDCDSSVSQAIFFGYLIV
jgi:hypothetical protein